MILIELLKNILPIIVFFIGNIFNFCGELLKGIATIFYAIAATLHMLLDTKTGKHLKDLDKATQNILALYNNIQTKITAQKSAVSQESDKLAKILKEDKNVIKLGTDSDDNSES